MKIMRRRARAESRPQVDGQPFDIEGLVANIDRLEEQYQDFPRVFDIETTNECNLRCPMCARTTAMTREVGDMSFELFKKIADELGQHDVEHVWLHIFGEPLMHPQIFEFIEYIKQYPRIKGVGLSTNVTVLNEQKALALVRSKLDDIILAVDAATSDAYAATRGANFDHVVRNVTRFLELRKDHKCRMQVQISLIPMLLNEKDTAAFEEHWTPYVGDGVTILFKPFGDFAGQVPDFGLGDGQDTVPVQFVVRGNKRRIPCNVLWQSLSIHAQGGVVACCLDVNGQLHLGDVKEQSIASIWQGPELRKLREAHRQSDFANYPLCDNCSLTREP